MSDHPFAIVVELFERLVNEEDDKLLHLLQRGVRDKIFISAPAVIIKCLRYGMNYKYNIRDLDLSQMFYGAIIYPSSDWAITFYHQDYCLYKKDWMIRKVPLDLPTAFSNQWYSKYVFEVQKLPLVSLKENNQN